MIKINPVQKKRFQRLTFRSLFLSLLFYSGTYAVKDSVQKQFFSVLEDSLIKSYKYCTKDSSAKISMNSVLQWKQQIDTFTSSPDYPEVIKQFREESGLDPSSTSPCVIYNWKKDHDQRESEDEQLLQENEELRLRLNESQDTLNAIRNMHEDTLTSKGVLSGNIFSTAFSESTTQAFFEKMILIILQLTSVRISFRFSSARWTR